MSKARERVVLIVEGDAHIRAMLSRAVEKTGALPVLAATATEGYCYLSEFTDHLALVLLDVTMERIDGFSLRELQLDAPRVAEVPTIVFSRYPLHENDLERLRPNAALLTSVASSALDDAITSYVEGVAAG